MIHAAILLCLAASAGAGSSPVERRTLSLSDEPARYAAPEAVTPVTLPGTEQFDLRAANGKVYRIFVAGPAGDVPEAGSPVLYLTDANRNFPVLRAAVQGSSPVPSSAVVVGIGYPETERDSHRTRRAFDLTPSPPGGYKTPPPGPSSGGADEFLAFIETELKPRIERRYRIDRTRQALFGHSYGSLFVLHALFSRPESFQTYLAASPSIWWNDGAILKEERAFLERFAEEQSAEGRQPIRVLLTVGEWEQSPAPGTPPERAAKLAERRMVDRAQALAERLNAADLNGLYAKFLEFPEENHGGAVLPAASRGVRFFLAPQRPAPQ